MKGFRPPELPPVPNQDKRQHAANDASTGPEQRQARDQLRKQVTDLRLTFHPVTGAPTFLGSARGFLSGPNGQGRGLAPKANGPGQPLEPHDVVKAFLKEHRNLFGHGDEALDRAAIKRQFTARHNGLTTMVWKQQVDGIDIHEAVLVGHVTRRGELVQLSSGFVPQPEEAAEAGKAQPRHPRAEPGLSARRAVALAAGDLGVALDESLIRPSGLSQGNDPERTGTFQAPGLAETIQTRLVWLPVDRRRLVLCWEVILHHQSRGESFRLLIHAGSGEIMIREGLTQYLSEASYQVYLADSPTPLSPGHSTPTNTQPPQVSRLLVTTSALDSIASPNGWIDDGGNETVGNNVRAQLDVDGNNSPDLPRPHGNPHRVFQFPLDLTQAPAAYGAASVVNLFYWNNWIHDRLYQLGFTEEAGNFQQDNFGRGGLENDPVDADAQDGSGVNNANMTTFADGIAGRMQMYLFNYGSPNRDGDLDTQVILHEYTHGLSNRRVGGGVGLTALQSMGLGEGWSDFYALALLSKPEDDPNANYPFGSYVSLLLGGSSQNYYFGIRRYPYTTDVSKDPLTFKDIDPAQANPHAGVPRNPGVSGSANQVHRQGEVWCSALWDARARLIDKLGFDTGNERILQLVTDGMNLTPPNPNFLQARDGILQADLINYDGAHQEDLWAAFARRGMGYGAQCPPSSSTAGIIENFDIPDELLIDPGSGVISQGPEGGPFQPALTHYALSNVGTNDLVWSVGWTGDWLDVLPRSGAIVASGPDQTLQARLTLEADFLVPGLYTNVLYFTNRTTSRVQSREILLRVGQPDYWTERFDQMDNDLAFQTLTFTPDGSSSGYSVCREPATQFLTSPEGSSHLLLGDDGFAPVTLEGGAKVALFGQHANVFFIGSNGYLTLDSGDTSFDGSIASHFTLPRISILFQDYDASGTGEISWKQMPDRVVVTYNDLPLFRTSLRHNFQVEWFFDGRIRLTWLELQTQGGLVGLSRGEGMPFAFAESDFGALDSCTRRLFVAAPAAVGEGAGTLPLAGSILLTQPSAAPQTVRLHSSNPAEARVPSEVLIPAGATNAAFDIEIVDDALVDGTQRAHLIAALENYGAAYATLEIQDNESNTLTLTAASQTSEGAGSILITAHSQRPVDTPVRLRLASSDPTELVAPESIVMPAGSMVATGLVQVVDDLWIDGPQTAWVGVLVENWATEAAAITVLDNETTQLLVTAPPLVNEAAGTLSLTGHIELSGLLTSNLTVGLVSSHPSRFAVPASVILLAGQNAGSFDLVPVDNALADGNANVVLKGQASGWTEGSAMVLLVDDEIPSPPGQPVPADGAEEVSARTILAWQYQDPGLGEPRPTLFDVYLGLAPDLGPAQLLGTTSDEQWTPALLAPLTTYYWRVTARRVAATPGPVWSFTTRGVDRFEWSLARQWYRVNTSFPVEITAKDEHGTTVSNLNEVVALSGLGGFLDGTSTLLISEVNPGTPDAMEFVNATAGPLDIGNWRISVYDNAAWPAPAVTFTLPPGTLSPAGGVFRLTESGIFPGTYPDFFTGVNISWIHNATPNTVAVLVQDAQGTVVDFMCAADGFPNQISLPVAVPVAQWVGGPTAVITDTLLDFQRVGTADLNNAQDWTAARPSLGLLNTNLTLPFLQTVQPVAISPTHATPFENGSWSSKLRVLQPANALILKAEDDSGHSGLSIPIHVALSNDCLLAVEAFPKPVVVGSNLTCTLTVYNPGPDTATGLHVTNTLPAGLLFHSVQSSQGQCTFAQPIVACDLGTLAPNETLEILIQAQANAIGVVTNSAALTRAESDVDPLNNRVHVSIPVVPVPVLEIKDAFAIEGNTGTKVFRFEVMLSTAVAHEIRADFATHPGTAQGGIDYADTNGTLVFPPGCIQQILEVPVIGDTLFEGNEELTVELTNAQGAILSRASALGTILNDDAPPGLSIGALDIQEPDSGFTTAVFQVSLTKVSGLPASARFQTSNGTALSGQDFESRLGAIVIPAGLTNATVDIPILGDLLDESDEQFFVLLNSPTNAVLQNALGLALIHDNDPTPVLTVGDAQVLEGHGSTATASFAITLSQPSGQIVFVDYATPSGTAAEGTDFLGATATLSLAPGQTNATINVTIIGDTDFEPDEYFTLVLSNPVHAVLSRTQALGTILNDDKSPNEAVRFEWDGIPSPQNNVDPVAVRLRALDASNRVSTNYNGTVDLTALLGGGPRTNLLSGLPPTATYAGHVTAGFAFTPSTNILVTHVRHFFGNAVSVWTDHGTLLVRQEVFSVPGRWVETPLAVPLPLQSGHRYRIAAHVAAGDYYARADGPGVFPHGTLDMSCSWTGDAFPLSADAARWYLVDLLYLAGAERTLPLNRPRTDPFTNGVWSGLIQIAGAGSQAVLQAQDADSRRGISNPFSIVPHNDLSLEAAVSSEHVFVGQPFTLIWTVHASGPADAAQVTWRMPLPANTDLTGSAIDQGTLVQANGELVANIGAMAGGSSVEIVLGLQPNTGGVALAPAATVQQSDTETILQNNALTLSIPVLQPVTITAEPQDVTTIAGGSGLMAVTAISSKPIQYQWMRGGAALLNATNSSLEFPAVLESQSGDFTVVVATEDHSFSATSRVARLMVNSMDPDGPLINLTFMVGPGYQALGSPILSAQMFLSQLMPSPTNGTTVVLPDGNGFHIANYFEGWSLPELPIVPGAGFLLKNPTTANLLFTMSGRVPTGALTNRLPAGLSLVTPLAVSEGPLETGLAFPAIDGDAVFRWNKVLMGYEAFGKSGTAWWPGELVLAQGQSFWTGKGLSADWVNAGPVGSAAGRGWITHANAVDGESGQFNFFTYNTDPLRGRAWTMDGTSPLGSGQRAQVFAGVSPDEAELQPVGRPESFVGTSGYIRSGAVTVPGAINAQRVFAQVRAWEAAAGSTYQAALAGGGLIGRSRVFTLTLGSPRAGNQPGLPPPDAHDFPSFRLRTADPNLGPVLAPVVDRMLHAGTTLTFTNAATDPDTPSAFLRYSLMAGPAGAVVQPVSGLFTWPTAPETPATTNRVTIRVTDDGLPPLSAEQSFAVVVLPPLALGGIMIDQGRIRFTWGAVPGTRYRIQYTEDLNGGEWLDLTGDVTAVEREVVVEDDLGAAPQRFYRIEIR